MPTATDTYTENARKAEIRNAEAALLLKKVKGNRDHQVSLGANEMLGKGNDPRLDPASFDRLKSAVRAAEVFDRQAEMLTKLADETRAVIKMGEEPRTYSKHSDNSYFLDTAAIAGGPLAPDYRGAEARLERYAAEVRATPAENRRALSLTREQFRSEDRATTMREESRAVSSATAAGFTTPQYLLADWVPYRSPASTFARAANQQPLPEYGLQVNVPSFTAATSEGIHTQNTGVDDNTPTGAAIQSTIEPFVGEVVVSQQLFDRGGYGGASFDTFVIQQLSSQLDASVDAYVIAEALTNAGTITDTSTVTTTGFYVDVSTAREQLADTAGTRLPGTHVFSTTDFVSFIESQVDSEGRPIVVPNLGPSSTDPTDPAAGYTGVVLPGSLRWYADDSIPAQTGNPTYTQVIVANMPDILVWTGSPISFAYPETLSADLSVVIGLRLYAASTPRHNAAVQVISGTGYASVS